jgi:tetratricopeptide (TPR) repeat protein
VNWTLRASLERFYRLSDPAHRTIEGLSFDAYAIILTWLALALAYTGYVDQARSRMNEALSEARRLKHAHTLAHVLVFTDWIDWLVCSPIVHSEETIELAREHGFPHYLGWGLAYRGKSLIELGQAQQGAALLTEGLAELRASEGVVSTPMLLTWLAEAHTMLGEPAKAQSYLAEAAQVVEATEERVSEAELLHRVPGDLLNITGDRDAAERSYRQALAVAERAVSAIVITVVMIGWGWGVSNGGGWGHSNQPAQMIPPASGLTDGPATRAWTPQSNGQFR